MKGNTIVIGGFLFQQLPAKIWGWDGKCDKCNYCSLPKFVKGFRRTKTAGCMALHCYIKQNKNMIGRKVKMPTPMEDIKKCERSIDNV